MPKNTNIQTHWVDVSSAVEIVQSNMAAKREIGMKKKILKIRLTLQIFRSIVFEKIPKT